MTFSIVLPVYNVAPYLCECLDSVLAQTYTDWEMICVDDGSTDGSGEILDEYAAKDPRFRTIHQSNRGVSAARNAALDIVKGEWILFVDGDDMIAPGTFEALAKVIARYPDGRLIRFGYKNLDDDGETAACVEDARCRKVDISRQLTEDDYYAYAWQFAFKRELVSEARFPAYIRGEDRVFLMRILCNGVNSYIATDALCYLYRQRHGSAMQGEMSVQIVKDELSHRADVIEMADDCGKEVHYRHSFWLEQYCVDSYQRLALSMDEAKRRELNSWFYHKLPRIRLAKDYSWHARLALCLYRVFNGRMGWRFVSEIWPSLVIKLPVLTHNPARVFRAIKRRMNLS